ncbi:MULTISPECIES: hypothetical protein [unclassified Sphingobacterium]|uniref:hypothetical protein n=1 Tax=unclassified Sphingobacterium TaxID=2609468 RepID=UPI00104C249D|nr:MULTISPECIES: hypothetical protein [unclassified Sphingobacterium]MCS3556216.1 hypothetical protein [Sphingobacterium sp. JUb21]TCR08588.1 hypothetical protein EDF66_103135 [Sphingobacterium sp. JUb20]
MTKLFNNKLLYFLVPLLLLVGVYSHFTSVWFSKPDDDWMLLDNILVTQFDLSYWYFKKVFMQINDIQYSPINTIYYALIYEIDGFNPFYFHFFSIAFHFFNFLLLYLIIPILIPELKQDNFLVLIVSLLWLIHPLNVESVIWISASKVVLSTTCLLLSLLFFLKIKKSWRRTFFVSLCLVMACFIKEQSILFPVVYLVLDLMFFKQKVNVIEYIIYFAFSVIFAVITLNINKTVMDLVEFSYVERISLSFYSIFWYLYNAILPSNLHYHYPFPIIPGQNLPWQSIFFIVVFIISLSFLIISKFYKNKYFYLVLVSIILISLSLHIVPMYRKTICADRYMYQPLLFLLPFLTKLVIADNIRLQKYRYLISIAFLIFFSCYSNILVENWINLNIK